MPEFFEYVLWQLKNSMGIVILICAVALGIMLLLRFVFKGKGLLTWGKMMLWMAFFAYLAVVLYATVLRIGTGCRDWNLHLFRAWREAWNDFSAKSWGNVLLNVALFAPLGFLLPLLGKRFRRWYVTIPTSFAVSLGIELLQLAIARGVCDVDDLFCNSLGAATGYFAIMAVLALRREKGKRLKPFLAYACMTMAPLFAIGGIFAAYHTQEYGNLPNAAAYRVDLNRLSWELDCNLPDDSGKVPVYRTRTMSKEDCDSFALLLMGAKEDMVSYYQEMAYYNFNAASGNGVVMIYYHDGSYEFRVFNQSFDVGEQPNRDSVAKALEDYAISVPDAASFAVEEDGSYSFTCDRYIDGDVMLNGTLRVRNEQTEDYTHLEIENYLIRYTYYEKAEVISPEQAYQALKDGDFAYADALKYDANGTAKVTSWSLDYEIDTKGFYQPVYLFEILLPENGYRYTAMIPAIK